jgi:hypothetical protein
MKKEDSALPVEDPRRVDRVRAHTAASVLDRIDRRTAARVFDDARGGAGAIERRLQKLDREWDVDRVMALGVAIATVVSSHRGRKSWRWWALFRAQQAALLLHAAIGWSPPVAVMRRLGVRTQKEIDTERAVLTELYHLLQAEPDAGIDVVTTYEVTSSPTADWW